MDKTEILKELVEHSFFTDMGEYLLSMVADISHENNYQPGEVLFKVDGAAKHFYLILKGSVEIELHQPGDSASSLQTLHEGEVIGWSWIIPPFKYSFDAKALDEVQVIEIDAEALRHKMEENHELGYQLMKRLAMVIAYRLHYARVQLSEV